MQSALQSAGTSTGTQNLEVVAECKVPVLSTGTQNLRSLQSAKYQYLVPVIAECKVVTPVQEPKNPVPEKVPVI